MRTYRTTSGPFTERPYFTVEEVEQICADELRKVNLYPPDPSPIRIERFIEKRFKICPKYEDLPEGILGFTKFGPKGVEEIVVAGSLSEEMGKISERRINTTLAHEAGHGLLHAHLFAFGEYPRSLFGDDLDPKDVKILCRKDTVQGIDDRRKIEYGGRWWEYQANLAIGGLLLPRPLVERALEPFLEKNGLFELKILDRSREQEATKVLVKTFDVNPIVAKIGMETMFPLSKESQMRL